MSESIIVLTTGQPGSGKSYSRVRWLVSDYLINNTGIYITNLPLDVKKISEDLSNRTGKPVEDYLKRLVLIPDENLDQWYKLQHSEESDLVVMRNNHIFPPAQYFDSLDLSNAHIAIDEFHLYFSKTHPPLLRELWNIWFAEIRKLGCTFEAITQDLSLLPSEFVGKVGKRVDLIPVSSTRDPFFKISMGDWYELRSGLFNINIQSVSQTEYRKGTSFTGRVKWVQSHVDKFSLSSEYWIYYNSYQRNDTNKSGSVVTPSERLGKKIIFWFLRRNFFKLLKVFFLVVLFFYLCFGGGLTFLINSFMNSTNRMASSNGVRINSNTNNTSKNRFKNPSVVSHQKYSIKNSPKRISKSLVKDSTDDKDFDNETKITEEINLYKPALFFDGFCWLRNGIKIKVGFQFKGGIYDGKRISFIDSQDRFYVLDDGVVVYMF